MFNSFIFISMDCIIKINVRRQKNMAINKEKCKRKELRDVKVSIRITKSMSKFMKEQKLSPSMTLISALEDLGYKYPKV